MIHSILTKRNALTCAALAAALAGSARGDYVTPKIGGGQVSMMQAPMKHADILFDGLSISVHVDDSVSTPALRPLNPPDEFDPVQPWTVLSEKAYNFQYAWNPGEFFTLPENSGVWIERLHHDAGLESYLRPPAAPAYAPVFESDGERWMWSGAMTHNVYAVAQPIESSYSATYRVYLGDALTGAALPSYGSAEVTWNWSTTPVLPGDCNLDGLVNSIDFGMFLASYGMLADATWSDGDFTDDGMVSTEDFNLLAAHFGEVASATALGVAVPEPATMTVAVIAVIGGLRFRRCE